MMNTNFAPEMAMANRFILEHNDNIDFMRFMRQMEDEQISHSERWSRIFDYMDEHYPGTTGSMITGLAYYAES